MTKKLAALILLITIFYGLEFPVQIRDENNDLQTEFFSDEDDTFGVVVCDMWDGHSCIELASRSRALAPEINSFLKKLRANDIPIVHAISGGSYIYQDALERQAMMDIRVSDLLHNKFPNFTRIQELNYLLYHPPIPGHVCNPRCTGNYYFSRAIAKEIEIDEADYIADDTHKALAFFKQRNIKNIFIVGVHSNACIIGRRFGVIEQIKFGFNPIVIRDLIDVAYTTDDFPHISLVEANQVMIEWFEQYLCSTATKDDF